MRQTEVRNLAKGVAMRFFGLQTRGARALVVAGFGVLASVTAFTAPPVFAFTALPAYTATEPDPRNEPVRQIVDQLLGDDTFSPARLKSGETIGLVASHRRFKRQPGDSAICQELCLRVLLNKTVKSFYVGHRPGLAFDDIGVDLAMTRYWLERRPSCPPVALVQLKRLKYGSNTTKHHNRPDRMMHRALATGLCLMSEPARLGDVDLVLIETFERVNSSTLR